jgi:hypothetical protein
MRCSPYPLTRTTASTSASIVASPASAQEFPRLVETVVGWGIEEYDGKGERPKTSGVRNQKVPRRDAVAFSFLAMG